MKTIYFTLLIFVSSASFASNEQIEKIQTNKLKSRFSVGGTVGARSFTGNQSNLYSDDDFYGATFSYLFNSHTALQLAYSSGTHSIDLSSISNTEGDLIGDTTITTLSVQGKYFLKTQTYAKKINPYALVGISQFTRETINTETSLASSEAAMGFDLGVGVEFVFNKNSFINLQFVYNKVDFSNENREIAVVDPVTASFENTGVRPDGDPLSLQVGFGLYF